MGGFGAAVSPTAVSGNDGQICVSHGKLTLYVTALLRNKLNTKYNNFQKNRIEMLFWKLLH